MTNFPKIAPVFVVVDLIFCCDIYLCTGLKTFVSKYIARNVLRKLIKVRILTLLEKIKKYFFRVLIVPS